MALKCSIEETVWTNEYFVTSWSLETGIKEKEDL
jgi:hypothetical protein